MSTLLWGSQIHVFWTGPIDSRILEFVSKHRVFSARMLQFFFHTKSIEALSCFAVISL